jgi:hypothetical protein
VLGGIIFRGFAHQLIGGEACMRRNHLKMSAMPQ